MTEKIFEVINLTPHTLNIVNKSGETISIPSTGVARVASKKTVVGEVCGFEVFKDEFGEVIDLPDPVPGTIFVVSRLVAAAVSGRDDIFVPGDLIRDSDGKVVGAKGLAVVA